MERQKHGFDFENICKKELGIIKTDADSCYTSKWDNHTQKGMPISIKLEKLGTDIELADYFRQASIEEDFLMVVGFWKDKKNNIVKKHYLRVPGKEFHELFNDKVTNILRGTFDGISNSREDDSKWKERRLDISSKCKQFGKDIIRPRFKRDHKNQKRIQCAINSRYFNENFLPKYEITKEEFLKY